MKPLLRNLFIPAMLLLGACCSEKDVVVVPAASPPPGASPASRPLPEQIVLPGLGDVFYDFNKSEFSTNNAEQLETNANWIKAHSAKSIIIEGNCDERGTIEYNLALGKRRANSARDYIIHLGVDPTRLKIISNGKNKPFASGSTEEAWAQNRNAHFVAE